jgi:hypothetical protein
MLSCFSNAGNVRIQTTARWDIGHRVRQTVRRNYIGLDKKPAALITGFKILPASANRDASQGK